MPVSKIWNEQERAENYLKTCYECGGKATLLCDAHVGGTFELNMMPNKIGIQSGCYTKTCSLPLCSKCATTKRGRDFCKFHSSKENRDNLLEIPDVEARVKISELSLKGYISVYEKME